MESTQNQFKVESPNNELQQVISFAGADGDHRNEIERDDDAIEPFDDGSEHREIDSDNPNDLVYWANQFQISINDLKAAIVLNGNSVREIKKYLSI